MKPDFSDYIITVLLELDDGLPHSMDQCVDGVYDKCDIEYEIPLIGHYLKKEDVYAVTSDRYREGIASMTEVLQDEMQMSEAQNNYINAHYNYRVTNLMLLKLTGQIESLVK